jgi:hypothetical protein
VAPKKDQTTNFFTPPLLLLLLDPGSEIDSKIKILDKQPVFATLVFTIDHLFNLFNDRRSAVGAVLVLAHVHEELLQNRFTEKYTRVSASDPI